MILKLTEFKKGEFFYINSRIILVFCSQGDYTVIYADLPDQESPGGSRECEFHVRESAEEIYKQLQRGDEKGRFQYCRKRHRRKREGV